MTSITAASQLRSWLRMGLAATSACLGMGLAMWLLWAGPGQDVGMAMIWVGLAILVLIPALNVVAVLLDEWSTKPRTFAMAAIGVLVLLIVSTVYKIWKT